jgi:hypothetical protein
VHQRERTEGLASETAVLVRVLLPNQLFGDDPLEELEGLATTAGTRVVGGLVQRREKPDARTFLGRGKLEDLKELNRDKNIVKPSSKKPVTGYYLDIRKSRCELLINRCL